MAEDFNDPKLAINRVYTRKGDKGQTALVGGQKVSKSSARIRTYGDVDELNAFVGQARQRLLEQSDERLTPLARALRRVQHELFNLGSILATLPEDVHPRQPRVREEDVTRLEQEIDAMNADLSPLRSFVLPGGSLLNTDLHLCRTVCRRVERLMVELRDSDEPIDDVSIAYINRLSDAFFVWSRWVIQRSGGEETLWDPNAID